MCHLSRNSHTYSSASVYASLALSWDGAQKLHREHTAAFLNLSDRKNTSVGFCLRGTMLRLCECITSMVFQKYVLYVYDHLLREVLLRSFEKRLECYSKKSWWNYLEKRVIITFYSEETFSHIRILPGKKYYFIMGKISWLSSSDFLFITTKIFNTCRGLWHSLRLGLY